MNTLIMAVYDEKSLRKKIRRVKNILTNETTERLDTVAQQDTGDALSESSPNCSVYPTRQPALAD